MDNEHLPTKFSLADVLCVDQELFASGGFSNVFEGSYLESRVALKCIRLHSTVIDTNPVMTVSHRSLAGISAFAPTHCYCIVLLLQVDTLEEPAPQTCAAIPWHLYEGIQEQGLYGDPLHEEWESTNVYQNSLR